MFKFLRGGSLIGAVIGKVENYIQHLERGVKHCMDDYQATTARIVSLENQADLHLKHATRGRAFITKLTALISE